LTFAKILALQHAKVEKVQELFPFTKFFENAPQPIFKGRTFEEDFDIAEGCFQHVKKIFTQLEVAAALMTV